MVAAGSPVLCCVCTYIHIYYVLHILCRTLLCTSKYILCSRDDVVKVLLAAGVAVVVVVTIQATDSKKIYCRISAELCLTKKGRVA